MSRGDGAKVHNIRNGNGQSGERYAVVNVYIGFNRPDLDFTSSHREYARRHGYEYVQLTESLCPDAPAYWSRHFYLREHLQAYMGFMSIDADAEILDTCQPFHTVLTANPGAAIFMALGHSFRPNAGMILLRGQDARTERFLDAVLNLRDKELPAEDTVVKGDDNGPIIHLLRKKEYKHDLHILPMIWNNTLVPTDWDFIRHYTGPMRKQRIARASK